jgi:hypothetical protein
MFRVLLLLAFLSSSAFADGFPKACALDQLKKSGSITEQEYSRLRAKLV